MHHQKYRLIVPFLAPAVSLYLVFVIWPYLQSFYSALTQWSGVSPRKQFVGLDNFVRLVGDANYLTALGHNLLLLVVLPVVTLSLALLFAALMTQGGQSISGAGFYRVVFFFPQVMAVAIIGILWSFILNPSIGLLNGFLRTVGLDGLQRAWLGDPATALWAVAAVVVWQAVGFYMVLFIAGMQTIPDSLYEAATIDGATRWTMFWRLTLPLIWGNVQVTLVFIGIAALDLFTLVQIMTEGGPNRASDVIAHYVYTTAFPYAQFGYATAQGVSLLFLTLVLTVLMLRLTDREAVQF
jgi:N-acetylglucosamine transport system permease protein